MGRRDRTGDKRGVPDGMALDAWCAGRYVEATHGKAWRKLLGPELVLPGMPGSWNHLANARAIQYVLGESDGQWWVRFLSDQLSGSTSLFGREGGTGEYPSYVVGDVSIVLEEARRRLAIRDNPPSGDEAMAAWMAEVDRLEPHAHDVVDVAERWLSVAMLWYALNAAPGAQGLDRPNRLSSALTVLVVGERTQGRITTPATVQLAAAAETTWDLAKVGTGDEGPDRGQLYLWPARVFLAGAQCDAISAAKRRALRDLVLDGDLSGVLREPGWLASIRMRTGWQIARYERGGFSRILETQNSNSTPTYAAAWGLGGPPRALTLDEDVRHGIPHGMTYLADSVATPGRLTIWAANGDTRKAIDLPISAADPRDGGDWGRRLWRVTLPDSGPAVVDWR